MDKDHLPRHSVLNSKKELKLFEDKEIYSLLHLHEKEFSAYEIQHYMAVAIEWVQDHLGKTLLTSERESVSYNNCFVLPCGPVKWDISDPSKNKDTIIHVIYGKKKLQDGEYRVRVVGDSVEIQVPFSWKEKPLTVQYVAGYGDKSDVPYPIRNAVLGTIEYLFNHHGNVEALEAATAPWLRGYKTYGIV